MKQNECNWHLTVSTSQICSLCNTDWNHFLVFFLTTNEQTERGWGYFDIIKAKEGSQQGRWNFWAGWAFAHLIFKEKETGDPFLTTSFMCSTCPIKFLWLPPALLAKGQLLTFCNELKNDPLVQASWTATTVSRCTHKMTKANIKANIKHPLFPFWIPRHSGTWGYKESKSKSLKSHYSMWKIIYLFYFLL